MDLDSALDRLYAVPLAEFTATRNELAKELASDDAEGARTVKALKKPNIAGWALNQLVRMLPDELVELFEATDNLRRAQRRVLSGGKAATLREATTARARSVKHLTDLAAEILVEAGHAASPTVLQGIHDSLMATSDEQAAEELRKGRLTHELRAESVVDVGGLTLIEGDGDIEVEPPDEPTPQAGSPRDDRAVRSAREAVTEARRHLDEARKDAKDADAEARKLAREAEDAERRAKSARESAEFARRGAEARRADTESAELKLGEAQRALREAESD